MSTTNYGLTDNLADGSPLPASAWDKAADTLDNGLAGALVGLGPGTMMGGAAGTAAGLALPLTAWTGLLPASADRGGLAFGHTDAQSVTVPASSTFSVWVVPVTGSYADGTPFDTAQTGVAALVVVDDGSTPDGGLALVTGISGATAITSHTDVRTFVGTAALAAALAALTTLEASDIAKVKAAIGADYFPTSGATPASLDSRVSTLEGGGGGTGGGVVVSGDDTDYWGALAKSATDAQTVPAYVAAQLPIPVPVAPPDVLTDDVVVVNVLKSIGTEADLGVRLISGGLMTGDQLNASMDTRLDVYFYDPRFRPASLYDGVNSTAPVNALTGLIG